jgi:hypothetical protein
MHAAFQDGDQNSSTFIFFVDMVSNAEGITCSWREPSWREKAHEQDEAHASITVQLAALHVCSITSIWMLHDQSIAIRNFLTQFVSVIFYQSELAGQMRQRLPVLLFLGFCLHMGLPWVWFHHWFQRHFVSWLNFKMQNTEQ